MDTEKQINDAIAAADAATLGRLARTTGRKSVHMAWQAARARNAGRIDDAIRADALAVRLREYESEAREDLSVAA